MKWFIVSVLAIFLCLQIASALNGYRIDRAEIAKLIYRVNRLNRFLRGRSKVAIVSYGVKSSTDNSYVRAITNLRLANGKLATGVALATQAVIDALNNKQTFRGIVVLNGKNYTAIYEPLIDHGDVTGFYAAAAPI